MKAPGRPIQAQSMSPVSVDEVFAHDLADKYCYDAYNMLYDFSSFVQFAKNKC